MCTLDAVCMQDAVAAVCAAGVALPLIPFVPGAPIRLFVIDMLAWVGLTCPCWWLVMRGRIYMMVVVVGDLSVHGRGSRLM
jgi:hypothetical protein